MEIISLIILAVSFPLFPVSMIVSFFLVRKKLLRPLLLVGLPSLSMLTFSEEVSLIDRDLFIYLALFTSLLYSLRSVSVWSLNTWAGYHFIAVFSTFWTMVGSSGINPIILVATSSAFLSLYLMVRFLEVRFGTSHFRGLGGLALNSPYLSFLLVINVLILIAVPPGVVFLNGLVSALVLDYVVYPILFLIWFLWSWSGIRVIASVVLGKGREDIQYEDISGREAVLPLTLMVISVAGGVIFLEVLS